jgi:hypothetical protein
MFKKCQYLGTGHCNKQAERFFVMLQVPSGNHPMRCFCTEHAMVWFDDYVEGVIEISSEEFDMTRIFQS